MVVGLATDSDGLKVAWIGAAGVVAMWFWCRLLVSGRGSFLNVAIAYFLVPAVLATFLVGFVDQIASEFEEIADQVYQKGDRGEVGLVALRNGLEAISHSPLVGWGPGAYSGLEHSFDSFEAHNTLVDWGMSTGGLGMMLYLGLLLLVRPTRHPVRFALAARCARRRTVRHSVRLQPAATVLLADACARLQPVGADSPAGALFDPAAAQGHDERFGTAGLCAFDPSSPVMVDLPRRNRDNEIDLSSEEIRRPDHRGVPAEHFLQHTANTSTITAQSMARMIRRSAF